jgi:hypothetical protein
VHHAVRVGQVKSRIGEGQPADVSLHDMGSRKRPSARVCDGTAIAQLHSDRLHPGTLRLIGKIDPIAAPGIEHQAARRRQRKTPFHLREVI